MAGWMAAGTIIGGTLGAAGGTAATVGSGGIALPAIPGGAAGGAMGGAAVGGMIGSIVCTPPPPLCMPKVKEGCFQRWKGCVNRCDADYSPFKDPVNNRLCRDLCKVELLLCQDFL
jgi:hypothetical protein